MSKIGIGLDPRAGAAQGLAAGAANGVTALTRKPMPKWSAAKSRVRLGTGRASALFAGTSITAGTNSADSLQIAGSFPYRLAARLTAAGLPCCTDSIWGTHARGVAFDARLSGANWAGSSNKSLGGNLWSSPAANRLTFTPVENCDRAAIRWLVYNGAPGDIDVYVDNALSVTLETAGASAIAEQTINLGSSGAHTVGVQRNGASGSIYVQSIRTWNSSSYAVDIYNAGWQSSGTAYWIDNSVASMPLPQLSAIAADLYVIGMDRNDCNTAVNLATYKTNLTLMVTTCKAVGDVVLFVEPPESSSVASIAQQTAYANVVRQVAAEQSVNLIDFQVLWTSYAVANGYGLYGDTVHPSPTGFDAMSQPFFDLLAA